MPKEKKQKTKPQHQDHRPGNEFEMDPKPIFELASYKAARKLKGKSAIVTGGDSGIGRAVAVLFAKEGADVAIVYLEEDKDAEETKVQVEKEGRKCILIKGDVGDEEFCKKSIDKVINGFGKLDILVNNASEQHPQNSIENISKEQLERTFKTNVFGYFFMTKYSVKHLQSQVGSSIVNTASVTAYKGSPQLLDYSASKGAEVAFTRSLSMSLIEKGIRVNGVAPGPIWTPLIPSTFPEDKVENFGQDVPLKRVGQPIEVATCYVFLASDDASYISGQILHPNGGTIING